MRGFLVPAAAVLLAASVSAQTLDAPVRSRIDSVFARFTGGPGCALGVIQGGALAYAAGYGLASVEHGVPITPATVFDIGSVSKQFTAMAIVLLAREGKLSLDDEIQRHVPEVPRYPQPVTIRHLLHHTSGLRDYIDVLSWSGVADEAVTGDREALAAIARQKAPNFEAGAEYRYSNSGYFLLSVIVKRVTGESLRDFAARRIFEPLGMTRTQVIDRHEMLVPGKAGSYAPARSGGFVLALANWEQTGDGAVNTSVEDMVKWNRNFTTGTVGGMAAIRMLESVAPLRTGAPNPYAFGQVVDSLRGVPRVSHGGSWAGFRAHFARYPGEQLSTVVLCNLATSNPGGLAESLAEILLADKLAKPVENRRPFVRLGGAIPDSARRPVPPAGIAGRYRSEELLADWMVSVRDDSVFARPGLGVEFEMVPGTDGFVAFGTQIAVVREGGRISGLTLNNRGLRNLHLRKVEEQ